MKLLKISLIAGLFAASIQAQVIKITSSGQLQGILNTKDSKVVVKFYSPTCPPCRSYGPIFNTVSEDPDFKSVIFAEVNIHDYQNIGRLYSISSMPTTIFFVGGKQVSTQIGAKSAQQLKSSLISQLLR